MNGLEEVDPTKIGRLMIEHLWLIDLFKVRVNYIFKLKLIKDDWKVERLFGAEFFRVQSRTDSPEAPNRQVLHVLKDTDTAQLDRN